MKDIRVIIGIIAVCLTAAVAQAQEPIQDHLVVVYRDHNVNFYTFNDAHELERLEPATSTGGHVSANAAWGMGY